MLRRSIKRAQKISMLKVYERYVEGQEGAPTERTFRSWIASGQKYAALAAAGALLSCSVKLRLTNRDL